MGLNYELGVDEFQATIPFVLGVSERHPTASNVWLRLHDVGGEHPISISVVVSTNAGLLQVVAGSSSRHSGSNPMAKWLCSIGPI